VNPLPPPPPTDYQRGYQDAVAIVAAELADAQRRRDSIAAAHIAAVLGALRSRTP
jgi:hypothetical protein